MFKLRSECQPQDVVFCFFVCLPKAAGEILSSCPQQCKTFHDGYYRFYQRLTWAAWTKMCTCRRSGQAKISATNSHFHPCSLMGDWCETSHSRNSPVPRRCDGFYNTFISQRSTHGTGHLKLIGTSWRIFQDRIQKFSLPPIPTQWLCSSLQQTLLRARYHGSL